jgi:competence protein ComEA
LLPGIGQKTAENIVAFRNKNGKFKKIDDLVEVPGIGNKKLDRIKKHIIIE